LAFKKILSCIEIASSKTHPRPNAEMDDLLVEVDDKDGEISPVDAGKDTEPEHDRPLLEDDRRRWKKRRAEDVQAIVGGISECK
jgi:hypothetical protein